MQHQMKKSVGNFQRIDTVLPCSELVFDVGPHEEASDMIEGQQSSKSPLRHRGAMLSPGAARKGLCFKRIDQLVNIDTENGAQKLPPGVGPVVGRELAIHTARRKPTKAS
jgi:hypothetical protein